MADMVDPSGVPSFTGDFGLLEEEAAALTEDAGKIRDTGSGVHSTFQGLSAFYTAPEADQLFGSTQPVSDRADGFADDLEKVAGALVGFAEEARPIVAKLERLKGEAQSFVDSVKDDDEWTYDEEKIETNNALVGDISAAVAEFWAAERSAANKITALVDGTRWVANDGSDGANMYGLSVEDMRQAGETPWGRMAEEDHHWYEVGHWVKSYVWDGFIVDGVWGTLTGLGGLVGLQGWETFKDSWKGLGQLATGVLIIGSPFLAAATYAVAPEGARTWMRESLNTTKEVGKSLVAWDEWGENPGRAAGLVTFNVLTTVATLGTGTAVRGASASGTAARVMNAAGRVGRVVDPMTYIGNGLSATFRGLPRLTDVTSGLADLSAVRAVELPDGTMRLPDGTTFAPDAPTLPDLPPGSTAVELPDGSVRFSDNEAVLPDGTLVNPTTGQPIQAGDQAPVELTADDRAIIDDTPAAPPEPALVGGKPADATAEVGDLGEVGVPPGQAVDHVPGGTAPEGPTAQSGNGPHSPSSGGGPSGPLDGTPTGRGPEAGSPSTGGSGGPPAVTPASGSLGGPSSSLTDTTNVGRGGGPDSVDPASTPDVTDGAARGDAGPGEPDAEPPRAEDATAEAPQDPTTTTGEGSGSVDDGPDAASPESAPREITAGDTQRTLDEVRKIRDKRERWTASEDYGRELYDGGPERHYPVPTNQDPKYPVTATGGRKVDVPVDLPNGKTLAVEIKMYQEYRTVKLPDGANQTIKVEVPLSKHIREQIHKDIALRRADPNYDPRWAFLQAPPSAELRAYLTEAKIIFIEYGPSPK